jgi:hypothetical protein
MNIKTVQLELVRPGPPHNQLLSPLTQYIALCGDEPPETFSVPFEHYRLLRRLQGLRPPRSPAEVDADLTELREDVVQLLCGIRCLATSLAEAHGDGADVIELELVLSASELSLIPFEIAFYPGSPTRELAHREVIVTRRSRRVPRGVLRWKHRPRVLVLAASPPGYPAVPIEEHVSALREALAPWLLYFDQEADEKVILGELQKFVRVVPNASELSIQEEIREAVEEGHAFTHVHVLAHGGELADDDPPFPGNSFREPRFGLVFHDSQDVDRRDTLSGRRLFSALAGSDPRCHRQLPQVLTIASCDSGNGGGVVVPGASVAHDVHDGGVPLVVAAQFPLTYHGSIVFTLRLYERLLTGDDPRCGLRETRRAVHAASIRKAGAVDWGAIVQYGALPHDLQTHVYDAKFRALRQRVDAAISSVDPLVTPPAQGDLVRAWHAARDGLRRLEPYQDGDPRVSRYVARVHIRWAFILRWWQKKRPERTPFHASAKEESVAPATMATWERCARVFRDGLRQFYRDRHMPTALVESLAGDFFVGDSISHDYVVTAVTECSEHLRTALPNDARRKLERALLDLWVLSPRIQLGVDSPDELGRTIAAALAQNANDPHWFERVLDRQFAQASPKDFEHFGYRRWLRRIMEIAEEREEETQPAAAPHDYSETLARANRLDHFLETREVPIKFRAIVDWLEQPDGGQRTVGT